MAQKPSFVPSVRRTWGIQQRFFLLQAVLFALLTLILAGVQISTLRSSLEQDYGIRALSKIHKEHPYKYHLENQVFEIEYEPGNSSSSLFGGNSNWRGPIWFPVNYLIIESLLKYHLYYGS